MNRGWRRRVLLNIKERDSKREKRETDGWNGGIEDDLECWKLK